MEHAMTQLSLKALLLLLAVVVLTNGANAKRKDDVVVMKNGDTFTGEVKELEHGELVFKSEYMKDSVHLDWKRVQRLRSKDEFIVSVSDGRRLTGNIERSAASESQLDFVVVEQDSPIRVSSLSIIRIEQQEVSFWKQLTGSVSYGFSFAGGNSGNVNSSLAADVGFNTEKNTVRLATSSQFDSQDHASNTNRITFGSEYTRALTRKWVAAVLFTLLRSDQQDLKLRSTYGAGIGRRLIQTDRTSLLAVGGAAFSHETYFPQPGTEPIRNNTEALLGLNFNTFRFKTLNFGSGAFLFSSLSEPGRFRFTSQSSLRIELVRNFYWSLQLYENHDTRPPVTAPKNDLGITTSLGWTF
jgi:putative salt-induced outer membrane protein YdiY